MIEALTLTLIFLISLIALASSGANKSKIDALLSANLLALELLKRNHEQQKELQKRIHILEENKGFSIVTAQEIYNLKEQVETLEQAICQRFSN